MKNSSDPIGKRTHDTPACSAVPQPVCVSSGLKICSRCTNLRIYVLVFICTYCRLS